MKNTNAFDKKELKEKIKIYYENKKNLTINSFFKNFLFDFQESCEIFSMFYARFCLDQKIYDFHDRSFYLNI